MGKRRQTDKARLESLLRISQHDAESTQELLDFALSEAIAFTRSSIGYIYFYNETSRQFTLNSWSPGVMEVCRIMEPQIIYDLERTGIWGEAVRQARPIVINDFSASNPLKKGFPAGHAPIDRFMTLPVFSQGSIVAVLGLANKKRSYTEADVQQTALMMNSVWQIAERTRLEQEKKHVQDVLEQSEARYRKIFQDSKAVMLLIDPDAAIMNANDSACRFYGYSREELLGKKITDINTMSASEVFEEIDKARTECRNHFNFRHRLADGTTHPVEVFSSPLDIGGKQLLYCIVHDITARVTAENALRQNEEKYRSILTHMHDGYFELDLDGNFTFANAAGCEFLGYSLHEVQGMTYRKIASPETARTMKKIHGHIYKTGIPCSIMNYEIIRKDGSRRVQEMNAGLIRDLEGQPTGFYVTARDITEKAKAEEALRESEERSRLLFNNIPVPTFVWKAHNDDFILTEFNGAAFRFMGDRILDFVGKTTDAFFQHMPQITSDIRKCMALRQTVENQFWFDFDDRPEQKYVIIKYAWAPTNSVLMHVTDITGQKRAEENLHYISNHDSLTGLANRFYADSEINRMAASRLRPVSVIVIDLNDMKKINDKCGHAAGDQYIKNVAAILKQTFRPEDMIARIGGDEFLVLLPLVDEHVCAQAIERMSEKIDTFNQSCEKPLSLSAGYATVQAGDNLLEGIREADRRMYQEKARMKAASASLWR